ncbi:hypothetical protein BKA69DRAFT_1099705 [Paraphysoderma sedebokerense]|nr:hypothetical protein BKA69DRAFT_1099705 [Paraphysoderma sedebokerense]
MDSYLQSVAHVDDERNEPPSKKMKNVSEIVLNSSPPRQRTHSRSPSKSPEYFRSPPPSQKSATMTPQRAEGSRNEQLIWSPSTSKLLDSITELPPDEGIRILCELSGQSKEVVLSVMYECSLNAKNCLDVLRRGHGATKSLWWTPEEDIILEHSTNPQERHKLRVSKGNKSMSRRRDFLQTARREGWLDQMYNVVENVKNGIE